ncbi:hypothetical protein C0Q70_14655 [Pomacea canaliculata]|uniref:Peroxidase n=1 Tax=Pomacea canaliculata TaxID=400727 RepID=A0A2T7NSP9_POMCA|nr:hypothetical protein C0Q70_14655 [Pomacea canaliculata]
MNFKLSVVFLTAAFISSVATSDVRELPSRSQSPPDYCLMPHLGNAVSTGSIYVEPWIAYQDHTKVHPKHSRFARYRTADGSGNHVFNLGMANTPPSRILPPDYENGVDSPRTLGVRGRPLPAALDVSRFIHTDVVDFQNFTVMLMAWGQFMDHDLAAFILSSSPRQQINTATSFIDASMVYGSSQEVQLNLREKLSSGEPSHLLRSESGELLPRRPQDNCIHSPGRFCFLAGDDRVSEQPGLTVVHTLFLQLHNKIARDLATLRPYDSHEEIFQLTRKIVGAIVQNIQYSEWLPIFLPKSILSQFSLLTGSRTRYLPTVDPSIYNAFATAVFRMGHTLIPAFFNVSGRVIPLRQLFNKPDIIFEDFKGVLLSLVSPLFTNGARAFDRFFTEEITGHLFEPRTQPPAPARSRGLDLIALNLQRGRDHGLPSYNNYREICGLKKLTSFSQFVPSAVGLKLATVYDNVDDIDLFTGLMSEKPLAGGLVGPTLGCLLGIQFHSLKFGDRFYFETVSELEGFTNDQLRAIRYVTLAHVICMSRRVNSVQLKAFEVFNEITNPEVDCSELRHSFIDLRLFK